MPEGFTGTDGRLLNGVLADAAERFGTPEWNLQWWAFPETWPSTSLGFGGMGGQALTTAQTVVVCDGIGRAAVYWGGRFGREVPVRDAQAIAAARSSQARAR